MHLDLALYRTRVPLSAETELSVIDISAELPIHTFLLLHDLGQDASVWRPFVHRLTQDSRVLAPDLPAHGESASAERPTPSLARLVEDVEAMLAALVGRGSVMVIGMGMGAAISAELARRFPARVSRQVLIAPLRPLVLSPFDDWPRRLPAPLLSLLQPLFGGKYATSLRTYKRMHDRLSAEWPDFGQCEAVPTLAVVGKQDARWQPKGVAETVEIDEDSADLVRKQSDAVLAAVEPFAAQERLTARLGLLAEAQPDEAEGVEDEEGISAEEPPSALVRFPDRPWLRYYPADVPPTIDVADVAVPMLLTRAVARFPDKPAVIFERREITWRHLQEEVAQCANALRDLGVGAGDRVVILLPNMPQMVMAFYATLTVGAVAVMIDPQVSAEVLQARLASLDAKVLVAFTRYQDSISAVATANPHLHIIYAGLREYMASDRALLFGLSPEQRADHRLRHELSAREHRWSKLLKRYEKETDSAEIDPRGLAVIQYTSGTIDEPKAVMLSHRNLVANSLQLRAWLSHAEPGQEVVLCAVPFTHVYGMTAGLNSAVGLGAPMILLARFDVEDVISAVRRYRPTIFLGVPAMYVAMTEHPDMRGYSWRGIRASLSAAAPLPVQDELAFERLTHTRLAEGYGLTEAAPLTHFSPIYGRDKAGSIGLPLPSTEARLVDLATGRPVGAGRVGELLVRGPQVMMGYWQDEAATAEVIDAHGWLHTGDIARMDGDGYFQILSRRQEMLLGREGKAFYPRVVEEVLVELPGVREAVVVAVRGRLVAFVQRAPNSAVGESTLLGYCQRRLPADHVPRNIVFVTNFPRTLMGRVMRRGLSDEVDVEE